jgi:hypothetical protein
MGVKGRDRVGSGRKLGGGGGQRRDRGIIRGISRRSRGERGSQGKGSVGCGR